MSSLSALMLTLATVGGTPQGELLDFTATWCGPCQSVAPTVERLKRKGYPIRKVDVDKNPELAAKYGVESIPQFVLVINGEPKQRLIGPQSEATLARVMSKIPRSSDKEDSKVESETALASASRPKIRRGIPIPFLGKSQEITAEDIETVRGQSEETSPMQTLYTAATERGPWTTDPMQASVRLRVNQNGSVNFGTGTIIESQPSHTLIITCGHIFRGSNENTEIAVDYFEGDQKSTWRGRLIDYDDQADVGLLAIKPNRVLPAIQISSAPASIQPRNLVFSVGCGNGDEPSRWQMFVKSVDQFVGSSIIECTQAPVSGRSGGGLFNRSGELIGICMAADRERNAGLYAGLKEIYKLLDRTSLSALYRNGDEPVGVGKVAESEPASPPIDKKPVSPKGRVATTPVSRRTTHSLTETEINAIATALQMSGKSGVTVCINSDSQSAQGYWIVISNRRELPSREATPVPEMTASSSSRLVAAETRTTENLQPGQSIKWENLLDSSTANESSASIATGTTETPVWAQ